MKRFLIFILFILNGCGISTEISYRLKNVEEGYQWKKNGVIYLVQNKRQGNDKIGGIYLDIEIKEFPDYKYDVLTIKSDRASSYINGKMVIKEDGKYEYIELLNGVEITKKDSKKIKVGQKMIEYSYKENPNTNFKRAIVYLPEKLSGLIMIELGKIKIGGEEYNTPKIYMQKYKTTTSGSVIRDIVNEGGEVLEPLYHSENWIDD